MLAYSLQWILAILLVSLMLNIPTLDHQRFVCSCEYCCSFSHIFSHIFSPEFNEVLFVLWSQSELPLRPSCLCIPSAPERYSSIANLLTGDIIRQLFLRLILQWKKYCSLVLLWAKIRTRHWCHTRHTVPTSYLSGQGSGWITSEHESCLTWLSTTPLSWKIPQMWPLQRETCSFSFPHSNLCPPRLHKTLLFSQRLVLVLQMCPDTGVNLQHTLSRDVGRTSINSDLSCLILLQAVLKMRPTVPCHIN